MMKTKIFIVFILSIILPAAGYGAEKIYDVLEVVRILDKTKQENCTQYKLEVLNDQDELVEREYCLNGDDGRHNVGTSIWVINTKHSRIRDQFLIYMYSQSRRSEKVIKVKTDDYPFKPSRFIKFLVPTIVDEGLQYRCVLSADGIIPVKTFKKIYRMKKNSSVSMNIKNLRKKLKKMQPWCSNDDDMATTVK